MSIKEVVSVAERAVAGFKARVGLADSVPNGTAECHVVHRNAAGEVLHDETVRNLIVKSGRDFAHKQCYGDAALESNGLNYIALSNDVVTEDVNSTTLSNEIITNGLSRAQGTYTHGAGTNTTTVDYVFTCAIAQQACQKAALFTLTGPPPAGTMQHVLGFTQRTLEVGDTISITFTITLG